MGLALIILMIPLLLCAKVYHIDMEKLYFGQREPVESFIPIAAFFDDYTKKLTIKFSQDWKFVYEH